MSPYLRLDVVYCKVAGESLELFTFASRAIDSLPKPLQRIISALTTKLEAKLRFRWQTVERARVCRDEKKQLVGKNADSDIPSETRVVPALHAARA